MDVGECSEKSASVHGDLNRYLPVEQNRGGITVGPSGSVKSQYPLLLRKGRYKASLDDKATSIGLEIRLRQAYRLFKAKAVFGSPTITSLVRESAVAPQAKHHVQCWLYAK